MSQLVFLLLSREERHRCPKSRFFLGGSTQSANELCSSSSVRELLEHRLDSERFQRIARLIEHLRETTIRRMQVE